MSPITLLSSTGVEHVDHAARLLRQVIYPDTAVVAALEAAERGSAALCRAPEPLAIDDRRRQVSSL
jgi:hypothetical protein